jgi:Predicted Fe-S oxidoreductases
MSAVSLRNVFVHVTKACNLRCTYCYFSADRALADEMTTREFRHLWPDMVSVSPRKVIFTGGEPLLRTDIDSLLGGLAEADPGHRLLRCLNTNGHLVTTKLAKQMIGLVDEFRVSVDGLAHSNDTFRNSGNFDHAVAALDILYSAGFEPKVFITVSTVTLADTEKLLAFLVRRGIHRFNINLLRPIGRGIKQSSLIPDPASAQDALERAFRSLGLGAAEREATSSPKLVSHCGVGKFLNLMPNGDVFPCHALTRREFRLGNVRETSLTEICGPEGALGAFQRLEFDRFSADDRIYAALASKVCLGEVYNDTTRSLLWKQTLPLNDLGPAQSIL